jgi:hypothetical protein
VPRKRLARNSRRPDGAESRPRNPRLLRMQMVGGERRSRGRQFTEQEVRAYAAQGIAEIKARAGGEVTPAIQREIDNVTDVMNSLLDEL